MNKTMIFAGVVIFLIVSWLTGFVNELNDEVDVSYGFNEKAIVTGDNSNYIVDVNGKEVLQLDKLSMQEKKNLWNSSLLKKDMLELFPNFLEMQNFIDNHIEDDGLFKKELLEHLKSVEEEYIGGIISEEQAKARLLEF
ncbi:hypothetical protein MNB_SV-14-1060 [hydrothermal vent metagenome]|uniref:Uncharacterized protein n=1 Tax=hydrothermal vent metagenome TaxID=652676 RepID=A0A1W1BYM0_9ZZZZ